MARPLDGITVVSLEHAIAAPFCTRQLAELGARVIKVERPGAGDFARGYDDEIPDRDDPQHIKKQYGRFLRMREADQADAGGFYTIFVTPAGSGGTYRLTTMIEVHTDL